VSDAVKLPEVAFTAPLAERLALSDRLVALLGPDAILVIGRHLAAGGGFGGLVAAVERLRTAAVELTDARQVKAIDGAAAEKGKPLSVQEIANLIAEHTDVDPVELASEIVGRVFAPAMTRWKLDVLAHVEVDGAPALESQITPGQANEVCWSVADKAGFFPFPAG
jgi:hypothetical protein